MSVTFAQGFSAAGVEAGISAVEGKKDLALVVNNGPLDMAAGVFTSNRFCAAPVQWTRKIVADGHVKAVILNSGGANACTGQPGYEQAEATAQKVAELLGASAEDVAVCSTGLIGELLPLDHVLAGADKAFAALANTAEAGAEASQAIMTTDTHPKKIALEFAVGGKAVRIGAIAKGSGMIHPNMATMLLFMTTDAKVAPAALQKALSTVVPATFNQISVDGDTSTNDTVLLLASGLSGAEIAEDTPDYDTFVAALTEVAEHLSRELAGDGEGATKLLECTVTGAPDLATARAVSKSVIHSTLFKAAMFGADANWGRVLCAIGYTPGDFDISKTSVRLKSKAGEVFVCENAAYHPYSEDEAAVVLKEDEIDILVDLGSGDATAKAWGCDLTYDYVKINGDYRT